MQKDTTKEISTNFTDEAGNVSTVVTTSTFRMNFAGETLTIFRVTMNEGEEVTTPIMIQPWKCLSNGTRTNFADAQDAFDWFEENIKPTIV